MDKMVSIITPCFNGEEFVGRYLESILNQTYKNVELIFVNDGSTDRTEDIVKSYISKFEENKMQLKYICQKNGGQASALNKGLEIFRGDYLTWPDSDDILTADSIEKKALFLEDNKEYGLVRTDGAIVKENNLSEIEGYFAKDNPNKLKEDLFLDLITENKVWFAPGCYMVRRASFLEVNPNKTIYETRAGQNWQMLLPITYKYKCGFIDKPLYLYVVRENSHSHSITDYEKMLKRCDEHEDILINTIESINMIVEEKKKYISIVKEKYIRKKLDIASEFKDKNLADKQYRILKNNNMDNRDDFIKYLSCKNKLVDSVIKGFGKIRSMK
ncbi:glycosyltransferase family A protein [Clostridium sp.]|uniref:glycosyltransferase family A protein n=1 Tax=Clostridium sp. TaxID=1506 RepID=UPI002842E260|nr:glycosyltransferase family A protein [Clostridium sp.]MDR3598472.1 glycosyltransferase family A protein [Clostridium sp.]